MAGVYAITYYSAYTCIFVYLHSMYVYNNVYVCVSLYLRKNLIRTDNDWLLAVFHVVFDLQHAVHPEPVSCGPLLHPGQQYARTVLFRLCNCNRQQTTTTVIL